MSDIDDAIVINNSEHAYLLVRELNKELSELKKQVIFRATDIREMLLQRGSCDEWSAPVKNLNLLIDLAYNLDEKK